MITTSEIDAGISMHGGVMRAGNADPFNVLMATQLWMMSSFCQMTLPT
jgi:hypothetical protein